MYVPATPVQPVPALAPVGVVSTAPTMIVTPFHTTFKVRSERLNVLENHRASVAGTMREDGRPSRAGRIVTLQALLGRRWRTLAMTDTTAGGRFRISYVPRRPGSRVLRLHFAGDAFAASARRRLG